MKGSRLPLSLLHAALVAALAMPTLAATAQGDDPQPAGSSGPAVATQAGTMPPAPPEDAARSIATTVRLSYIEGTVRLFDTSGKAFDKVIQNMAMLPGMRLETGNDGRAELQFADGSVARATPNSGILLVANDAAKQGTVPGQAQIRLKPTKGLTYYELAQHADRFTIEVGPLTARAAGADEAGALLLRVNLDVTPIEAAILRGRAHLDGADGNISYDLEANQTARIDPTAANNYDVAQELTPDTWDAWNGDRDNALAELGGARSGGVNAGAAGWSDLDYYGRWYDLPGEGMAWAPSSAGADFDPYGSGAWGYSSGAGYSWVSGYPWGWLPYHCGQWSFFDGSGWMWLPGNCGWGTWGGGEVGSGGGWYPYPRLLHTPLGYRLPARPVRPLGGRPDPRRPVNPVIMVQRGPQVAFRQPGEPRPVARPVQVAGQVLQPRPVEARPVYRSNGQGGAAGYGSGFRAADGVTAARGSSVRPGEPGYAAGARMIAPSPGMGLQRGSNIAVPLAAPRPPAPVAMPRMSAPAAAPAPHFSAPPPPPAPAPAAAGHPH